MDNTKIQFQVLEEINGTSYPNYDVSKNIPSSFKRLIAPINPFKFAQSSSGNTLNTVPNNSSNPYFIPNYPNDIKFSSLEKTHADHNSYEHQNYSTNFGMRPTPMEGTRLKLETQKVPLVCTRYLNLFKRCTLINDRDKCFDEENKFLSVCPNFALEMYRESKLLGEQIKQIQRKEFRDAMSVSPYNFGRKLSDINGKVTWEAGKAKNLRPDSMWVDDRYVDVTQKDIDEAKARRAEFLKTQKHSIDGNHGIVVDNHHSGHEEVHKGHGHKHSGH